MKVIDNSLLDKISADVKESPRLRMNYNFLKTFGISEHSSSVVHTSLCLREERGIIMNRRIDTMET